MDAKFGGKILDAKFGHKKQTQILDTKKWTRNLDAKFWTGNLDKKIYPPFLVNLDKYHPQAKVPISRAASRCPVTPVIIIFFNSGQHTKIINQLNNYKKICYHSLQKIFS